MFGQSNSNYRNLDWPDETRLFVAVEISVNSTRGVHVVEIFIPLGATKKIRFVL